MKLLMFSSGLDSTYMAWKELTSGADKIHIHYISIRNDVESIWKREDVASEQIIKYLRNEGFDFEYSKSKFEFYGFKVCGFDSDLILLVAQKVAQNLHGYVDVLMGWNPYDMQRPAIADRANRNVTSNIWKSLVESALKGNFINKELKFPLIEGNITKDEILKEMPQELIDLTWSCRKGEDVPCGKCHACIERRI